MIFRNNQILPTKFKNQNCGSEIIKLSSIDCYFFISDSDGCCERFRGTRARSALPSITIPFEGVGAFFPVPHEISLGRSHHFFASLFPKTSGTSGVSRGGILESLAKAVGGDRVRRDRRVSRLSLHAHSRSSRFVSRCAR